MKIAICLSGYLRNYKESYKPFKELMFDPLSKMADVDFFISTWEGSKDHGLSWTNKGCAEDRTKHDVSKIDLSDIYKKYEYKGINIHTQDIISELLNYKKHKSYTEKLMKEILKLKIGDTEGNLWQRFMFFKIKDCCDLKKTYERKFDFKYDLCFKIRSDLILSREVTQSDIDEYLNKDFLFSSSYDKQKPCVWDVFWAAKNEIFDKSCDFNFEDDICAKAPEFNLNSHFKKQNIEVTETAFKTNILRNRETGETYTQL